MFNGLTLSFPISADVTAFKVAVVDGTSGEAANASTEGAKSPGIFQGNATFADGDVAAVQTAGVSEVLYGAAADFMASLMTDTSGRVITAAGDPGDVVWCVGFALKPGAAADDIGEILVHPHQVTF